MNYLEALNYGNSILKSNKINSYSLDTELLLSEVLKHAREKILINLHKKLDNKKFNHFKKLVLRRKKNEPIAHILNKKRSNDIMNVENRLYGQSMQVESGTVNLVPLNLDLNDDEYLSGLVFGVEVEGIDLCRPCRHLTEILNQENIIKEFLRKGGLRCQILNSSIIKINDLIKV